MADDLSSLFAEQRTNQIDWDGPLYSLYELPSDGAKLAVRFKSAISTPPQGLRLKIRGGVFEANGVVTDDLTLWQDTAPPDVAVLLRWKSKRGRSLRVWNAWRVKDVTQAWLGNAAMRVAVGRNGLFKFSCSDGVGPPDFSDLVVEIGIR